MQKPKKSKGFFRKPKKQELFAKILENKGLLQKSKNREPFAKTQKNKGFFRKPKKADNDNDNVNDNEDVYDNENDNVDEDDTDTVNENDAAKAAGKSHKGVKNKKARRKYKACRGGSLCFQKYSYMGFLFYGCFLRPEIRFVYLNLFAISNKKLGFTQKNPFLLSLKLLKIFMRMLQKRVFDP